MPAVGEYIIQSLEAKVVPEGQANLEQGAQRRTPSKCTETRPGFVGREACPSP